MAGLFPDLRMERAVRKIIDQQLLVDEYAHRSFHAQVKEKSGHPPLSALKLLKSDPAAVLAQSEEIKARYAKLFRV